MTITTANTDIQERLSVAYITAVAARAGCQVMELHVDRNGVDCVVKPIKGPAVAIDVQLKATSQNIRLADQNTLSFQLDAATYDKLRRTDVLYPQILVVYAMPSDDAHWLGVDENSTTLKHAAFWIDLIGKEDVKTESVAIHIPNSNLFDHHAIRKIIEEAHERAIKGTGR